MMEITAKNPDCWTDSTPKRKEMGRRMTHDECATLASI